MAENQVKNGLMESSCPGRNLWGLCHTELFNYMYKQYIKSHYEFLKQSFFYDKPAAFPTTAREDIDEDMWKYPAYIVLWKNNNIRLYEGKD